jgi:hypothetical protein
MDNEFASDFLKQVQGHRDTLFPTSIPLEVCEDCQKIEIWQPQLKIQVLRPQQLRSGQDCPLCVLLWTAAHQEDSAQESSSILYRVESSLCTRQDGPPVLSIYSEPGTSFPVELIIEYSSTNLYGPV